MCSYVRFFLFRMRGDTEADDAPSIPFCKSLARLHACPWILTRRFGPTNHASTPRTVMMTPHIRESHSDALISTRTLAHSHTRTFVRISPSAPPFHHQLASIRFVEFAHTCALTEKTAVYPLVWVPPVRRFFELGGTEANEHRSSYLSVSSSSHSSRTRSTVLGARIRCLRMCCTGMGFCRISCVFIRSRAVLHLLMLPRSGVDM